MEHAAKSLIQRQRLTVGIREDRKVCQEIDDPRIHWCELRESRRQVAQDANQNLDGRVCVLLEPADVPDGRQAVDEVFLQLGALDFPDVLRDRCDQQADARLPVEDVEALLGQLDVDHLGLRDNLRLHALLEILLDLLAERFDGLLRRNRFEDHHKIGDVLAGAHGSLLERADLADFLQLAFVKVSRRHHEVVEHRRHLRHEIVERLLLLVGRCQLLIAFRQRLEQVRVVRHRVGRDARKVN